MLPTVWINESSVPKEAGLILNRGAAPVPPDCARVAVQAGTVVKAEETIIEKTLPNTSKPIKSRWLIFTFVFIFEAS
jgi:hypothetical protein